MRDSGLAIATRYRVLKGGGFMAGRYLGNLRDWGALGSSREAWVPHLETPLT